MNSIRLFILLVLIGLDPLYAKNTEMKNDHHPIFEQEQRIEKRIIVDVGSNNSWHNRLYLENRVMNDVDIKSVLSSIIDGICHKINVIKSIIRAIDQQLKPLAELNLQESSVHFTEHNYPIRSSIITPITTVKPVIAVQPNITVKPVITVMPNTTLEPVIIIRPLTTVNPVTIMEPMTTVKPVITSVKSAAEKPNDCIPNINIKCSATVPVVPPSYQIPLHQQNNYYHSSPNQFWPNDNFPHPNPQIDYQQYVQYVPSPVFTTKTNSYTSGHVYFPENNHQNMATNYQNKGTNYQNTGINYNPEKPINSNIRPDHFGYNYDRLESTYPRNPVVWPYASQTDRPEAFSNFGYPKSVVDSSLLPIEHRDFSGEQYDLGRFQRPAKVQHNRGITNRVSVDGQQSRGVQEESAINHNYDRWLKIPALFKSKNGTLGSDQKNEDKGQGQYFS